MTFDDFADELLKFTVISSFWASPTDIMFDVYLHNYIKNVGRENCSFNKWLIHRWSSSGELFSLVAITKLHLLSFQQHDEEVSFQL